MEINRTRTPSPHDHPHLGLTVYSPVITIMADNIASSPKLEQNKTIEARFSNVLSRGRAFICFMDGYDVPVILAKVIAAEDGYVHRTQLIGQMAKVTPTQAAQGTSGLPGWLATVELPMSGVSSNQLLAHRQQKANDYSLAQLYAANTPAEA